MDTEHCRSCGAHVIWCVNANTGKRAPIDKEPVVGGNIIIRRNGTYEVVRKAIRESLSADHPLYTNHFMTCPQAKTWHKKG